MAAYIAARVTERLLPRQEKLTRVRYLGSEQTEGNMGRTPKVEVLAVAAEFPLRHPTRPGDRGAGALAEVGETLYVRSKLILCRWADLDEQRQRQSEVATINRRRSAAMHVQRERVKRELGMLGFERFDASVVALSGGVAEVGEYDVAVQIHLTLTDVDLLIAAKKAHVTEQLRRASAEAPSATD